jgi:hypothetical protein
MEKYHDAEILKIEYIPLNKEFIMGLVTSPDKKYIHLSFQDTQIWELTPFDTQNIIFEISSFDKTQIKTDILEHYEVHEFSRKLIYENNFIFYEIISSVGLQGYIIAKNTSPLAQVCPTK